tara:strand:- start:2857 stop:3423 length:567 start_codon:yes stop_codon:yes gene_type:complete
MSINVKIGAAAAEAQPDIKLTIKEKNVKNYNLHLRKALNGDLMIFDHTDIDIIVMLQEKKVVAFAKDIMSEVVYGAEDRLFSHLREKGIIKYDSIKGGNVYGSLEGQIHDSQELDEIKATLIQIAEWIQKERPYFEAMRAHDDMMDDYLTDPSDQESTELGDVPHEEEKGSILQHNLFAPYLYGRYTY